MNKLNYCYHTHTFRCGHAAGRDEEYVKAALEAGVEHLGFSDHVMLPGANQRGIRGNILFLNDYIYCINKLKEKYKNTIDIKLGFECEWFGGRFKNYYESLFKEQGFDYLILGEHCTIDEFNNFQWYGVAEQKTAVLQYADSLVEAMSSGLFTYVAHADHFMIWYPQFDEFAAEACRRIGEASVKYNVPLEINLGSLRRDCFTPGQEDLDCAYPKVDCWKIFAQCGVKAVIGYDAHFPKDFEISKTKDLPYAFKLIEDLGLHFVTYEELFENKK